MGGRMKFSYGMKDLYGMTTKSIYLEEDVSKIRAMRRTLSKSGVKMPALSKNPTAQEISNVQDAIVQSISGQRVKIDKRKNKPTIKKKVNDMIRISADDKTLFEQNKALDEYFRIMKRNRAKIEYWNENKRILRSKDYHGYLSKNNIDSFWIASNRTEFFAKNKDLVGKSYSLKTIQRMIKKAKAFDVYEVLDKKGNVIRTDLTLDFLKEEVSKTWVYKARENGLGEFADLFRDESFREEFFKRADIKVMPKAQQYSYLLKVINENKTEDDNVAWLDKVKKSFGVTTKQDTEEDSSNEFRITKMLKNLGTYGIF